MKHLTSLALAALLSACASSAPEQVALNDAPAADDEKVVCRFEAPTGSQIPKRVCRTVRDIARRAQTDRETAESISVSPHDVLLGR